MRAGAKSNEHRGRTSASTTEGGVEGRSGEEHTSTVPSLDPLFPSPLPQPSCVVGSNSSSDAATARGLLLSLSVRALTPTQQLRRVLRGHLRVHRDRQRQPPCWGTRKRCSNTELSKTRPAHDEQRALITNDRRPCACCRPTDRCPSWPHSKHPEPPAAPPRPPRAPPRPPRPPRPPSAFFGACVAVLLARPPPDAAPSKIDSFCSLPAGKLKVASSPFSILERASRPLPKGRVKNTVISCRQSRETREGVSNRNRAQSVQPRSASVSIECTCSNLVSLLGHDADLIDHTPACRERTERSDQSAIPLAISIPFCCADRCCSFTDRRTRC